MIVAFCNSLTLLFFFSKCITAPNDLKNSLETLIGQTYSLLYEQQFGTKNMDLEWICHPLEDW